VGAKGEKENVKKDEPDDLECVVVVGKLKII
jgi:hypothetical protein